MTQKTFYIPFENEYGNKNHIPAVGDVGVLVDRYPEGGEAGPFDWRLDKKAVALGGIPANMNHDIRCYHGWRGTSFGMTVYAHGVRKVKKVRRVEKAGPFYDRMGGGYYAITVGNDIHPDWA